MNNRTLYLAINEIDENLILEADSLDFEKNYSPVLKKSVSLAASAAVFLVLLTCSAIYFTKTNKPLTAPTTVSDTSLQQSSKAEPTKTTSVTTTDFAKSPDTDGLAPDSDAPDYSLYTLTMWLNNPDVVWDNHSLKGEFSIDESTPLGTVKITDRLKSIIKNNGDISVYAVLVDFSSCVDEEEAENWKYNGVSVKELQEYFERGYKTDKDITEYKKKLREIKDAYNNMRIKAFEDTFNKFGLKIYTFQNDTSSFSHYFYVFATSGQIQNLECKTDEAFVLSPAAQFKIK